MGLPQRDGHRRRPAVWRAFAVAFTLVAGSLTAGSAAGSHIVASESDLVWGCARRDCIPAIDDPAFDDGGWLRDTDRVVGVVVNGDARAYATRILDWHEIANDVIGGTPVAVTYCPLCGTGIAYERVVAGEVTTFGVSGRLLHNDLVMYDRATETLWPQMLGEGAWGPQHGDRLALVPATTTTWGEWRAAHPGTQALARPDTYPERQYDRYPYGNYENNAQTLFGVENPSAALHPKAWVLGAFEHDKPEAVAFPRDDALGAGLVRETLNGRDLIVVPSAGAPRAFFTGDRSFSIVNGALTDDAGKTWDKATGAGPDGATLEMPAQVLVFWFAWHDFHPDTRVWGKLLASVTAARDDGTRDGDGAVVAFSEAVDPDLFAAELPDGVAAAWLDNRTVRLTREPGGPTSFTLPARTYGQHGGQLTAPLEVPLTAQDAGGVRERLELTPGFKVLLGAVGAAILLGVAWASRRQAGR